MARTFLRRFALMHPLGRVSRMCRNRAVTVSVAALRRSQIIHTAGRRSSQYCLHTERRVRSPCPAVPADQRHEHTRLPRRLRRAGRRRRSIVIRSCLRRGADRNHQPAAVGELRFSGSGTCGRAGGDEDGVVGRPVGSPVRAVADDHRTLAQPERQPAARARLLGELGPPLDRDHLARRAGSAPPPGSRSRCRSRARATRASGAAPRS